MAASLEGLLSPKYARSLLSANMRLFAEMQAHLWRIQDLAISISEPDEYNEISTLDYSAGARPIHCGVGCESFSIAFSSRINDRGTGYISEINVIENNTAKHTLKDDAKSNIRSSASPNQRFEPTLAYNASPKPSLFLPRSESHPSRSTPRQNVPQTTGGATRTAGGDIDGYFNDLDEFYLAMAASEAVHAKRRALAQTGFVRKEMSRDSYAESRMDLSSTTARTLPRPHTEFERRAYVVQSASRNLPMSTRLGTSALNLNGPSPFVNRGERRKTYPE